MSNDAEPEQDVEVPDVEVDEDVEAKEDIDQSKQKKQRARKDDNMTNAERKRHKKKLLKKKIRERREKILKKRHSSQSKFQIKCKRPVEDEIFDVDEFVKYIKERFKINGETGNVGPGRIVNINKNVTSVHVTSKKPFPKYYLKYLTKRYLKKHGLRDYVRVIADKKSSYELRYFNIQDEKPEKVES